MYVPDSSLDAAGEPASLQGSVDFKRIVLAFRYPPLLFSGFANLDAVTRSLILVGPHGCGPSSNSLRKEPRFRSDGTHAELRFGSARLEEGK